MSGSPCPTCRNPMRWIPAMQQWGCDTCRVMFPAQPVVQAFAMAMTPKKSSKGLVIGISLLAIAGAGAAITLIAMKAKKPAAEAGSGSAGSAEPVVAGSAAPIAQKPIAMPPAPPAAPKDLTLGTPEQLAVGDLWVTPRKDGAFVVTSPLVEVVFPHRPTAKVEASPTSTANGKRVEVYTLSDDLQGRGLLQLQITAVGSGARDVGTLDIAKSIVAKVGTVVESHTTDRGIDVARLEATSTTTGETARVDIRSDMARGLLVVATTFFIKSDQANAKDFLDSVHLRPAPDPFDDPKTLTVRIRKEHGKNQAHDVGDAFAIDMPWATKVARIPPAPGSHVVKVTVSAAKGKASVLLVVEELSAWEGLAYTPAQQQGLVESVRTGLAEEAKHDAKVAGEKLGGLPASRVDAKGGGHSYHTHVLWNRYQHRRYTLFCVDAPCDVVALSLKLAAPLPTP